MFRQTNATRSNLSQFHKSAARRRFARALGLESLEERRVMAYAGVVLADNPSAYYKLDETMGMVAADAATVNNGTIVNFDAADYSAEGAFSPGTNDGLNFDGVNNYIQIPATAITGGYPAPTANLTIEVWFKTDIAGGVIFGVNGAPANPAVVTPATGHVPALFVADDGKLHASLIWHDGTGTDKRTISTVAVNDGKWHHAVVTFNGSARTQKLYLDGKLNATTNDLDQVPFPNTTEYNYFLGTGYTTSWEDTGGGWDYFQGGLDEFAIYNREITLAEVQDHYLEATQVQTAATGMVVVTGTSGNDRITIQNGGTGLNIRVNNRTYSGINANNGLTIYGHDGNDTITYAAKANVALTVYGGKGNDYIATGGGDDELHGGEGNDRLLAGSGEDELFGDEGNDALDGGLGNDELEGGAGNDNLNGNLGDDTLVGDAGRDSLYGGAGNDELDGGDDADALDGGASDDVLFGGDANDRLYGRAGNDVFGGGDGADTLYGGAGQDLMFGENDYDLTMLIAFAAEWFGDKTLEDRITEVEDDDLTVAVEVDDFTGDATSDGDIDTLYGEAGADWFVLDKTKDKIRDFRAPANAAPDTSDIKFDTLA